jgi:hypothetical protein
VGQSATSLPDPSGAWGRLSWAWGIRRHPRSPVAWLRLVWHDFIAHGVLNRGGERCQECGRGYVLWRAPDALYEDVHGSCGGLLCPACFERQAAEKGISVEFRAVVR